MKKFKLALLTSTLLIAGLTSCGSSDTGSTTNTTGGTTTNTPSTTTTNDNQTANTDELVTLVIGATPAPHAEILEEAKPLMEELGYNLEITEFTDYVLPNTSLSMGDIDGNYFQHQPYLDQFNEDNGTELVSVSSVHYEPFGVYSGKSEDLATIPEGAVIAVPNDTSNQARALLLLEAEGILSIAEGAGINATKLDIEANYYDVEIKELEAAQITMSLQDVDFAVINGNYAVQAGLNVVEDSLAQEDAESIAATTYGNILVVNAGNEEDEGILALVEVLEGDVIREFIIDNYGGAVLPLH